MDSHFGSAEVLIAFDRDGSGSADTGVLAAALTAATEEIDSYVGVKYNLPLAVIPGVLMRVCCDLAMYHGSINSPAMTEDKETRYGQRIKWLKDLAKGMTTLGISEEQVVKNDTVTLSSDSETRLFTRTKMRGLL